MMRFELTTFPMDRDALPSCLRKSGDDEIRTHDLCSAIAALSQLSYIPKRTRILLELCQRKELRPSRWIGTLSQLSYIPKRKRHFTSTQRGRRDRPALKPWLAPRLSLSSAQPHRSIA